MSSPNFRLDGKIALITGASSGLGCHFAKVLAAAGAQVIVTARSIDKLSEVASDTATKGRRVHAIRMDVTEPASIADAFDQAERVVGLPDVIVNNAGLTVTKPLLKHTIDDWDIVIDTNLKGNWLVATEAARRLVRAERGGSIVNIASILGERVAGGIAPYAISKAGIVQATKAMALELARHDIRVNALLPGYVVTNLNRDFLTSEVGERLRARIPSRKFVDMDELDGPLLLLSSDAGRAMSGACLVVDWGHLVSSL